MLIIAFATTRLPLYLLIFLLMLNTGTLALSGHAAEFPNPFAPFADILPGQARSAVIAKGFSCGMGTYAILPDEYCVISPADGFFDRIGVVVSKGIIKQTDFTIRENAIVLGDLAALWGRPVVQRYGPSEMYFIWPSGVRAWTIGYAETRSLFIPLQNVIFTEMR